MTPVGQGEVLTQRRVIACNTECASSTIEIEAKFVGDLSQGLLHRLSPAGTNVLHPVLDSGEVLREFHGLVIVQFREDGSALAAGAVHTRHLRLSLS